METSLFQVDEKRVLQLRYVGRDVAIRGWDRDDVQLTVDGSLDQCTSEEHEDRLVIDCHVPFAVDIPLGMTVHVEQVSGDLLMRNVEGPNSVDTVHGDISLLSGAGTLSILEVHGDLAIEKFDGKLSASRTHATVHLTQVSAASLGQVHGDVFARTVQELKMGSVSGDIQVSDIGGPLVLENGRGDFRGKDLRGGLEVQNLKGDLVLQTALMPGQTYAAQCEGNLIARLPAEASARFTLAAQGRISTNLPHVQRQEQDGTTVVTCETGQGAAQVNLSAGGDLTVMANGTSEKPEELIQMAGTLAGQIEAQIAEHIGQMDMHVKVQREIDKAMRKAQKEIAKAQRHVERRTVEAQERARRAEERAQRAAERARAKIAKSRRWGISFSPEESPFPPETRARTRQVSEEEQLAVLRMLQENKISAQEAEMLLKALEG
jgi:hypothetical protein